MRDKLPKNQDGREPMKFKRMETPSGTRSARKTETERACENRRTQLADQAQLPHSTRSRTTGGGLEASARLDSRAV